MPTAENHDSSTVTLHDVAHAISAEITQPDPQVDPTALTITGISLDSAAVSTGEIFAALPGTRTHGAKFAASTPAAAVLTDASGAQLLAEAGETRPVLVVADVRAVLGTAATLIYGDPSRDMTVIGITGTSGKTTTSYLVEAGLMATGASVGLIGTTGTRINGNPVPTTLTTPEAPTLQHLFADMRDQGVTHVVMEVSSHALSLGRVQGTHFALGAFTNLSQDHLDFHPTMEDYFAAKELLFAPSSEIAAEKAVVCVDDSWGEKMAKVNPNTWTVGTHGQAADVTAEQPQVTTTGAQDFDLHCSEGDRTFAVRVPLPGRFNVANTAVATAIALRLGVDMNAFLAGIADVAVPGRMQQIDEGQDFIAVVDYAHKPAAIGEVLDTLRTQVRGRIGIIVGAGGNRDHSKRPVMGAAAAQRADLVIVTDDNPRDEDPADIRQAVLAGAREVGSDAEIREYDSRGEAIAALAAWAQPGDAIVVAGKGHETGQLANGVVHEFDDRESLRQALRARMTQDSTTQA